MEASPWRWPGWLSSPMAEPAAGLTRSIFAAANESSTIHKNNVAADAPRLAK